MKMYELHDDDIGSDIFLNSITIILQNPEKKCQCETWYRSSM